MSQLYAQLASRPDPWLIGRTSAGLCALQTACPLTVTYSGGSPAADTIAAATVATVYGGSAVAFDASADVWVVLTVQGSGALQVVKEADLATVSGDWAGLARVVQHTIEPYQPSAYLASGGLGGTAGTPSTSTVLTSGTAAKAYSLAGTLTTLVSSTGAKALSCGAGGSPPSGWETTGFNDSGWGAAAVATIAPTSPPSTGVSGTSLIWAESVPTSATEVVVVRHSVSVPAGTALGGNIQLGWDDYVLAVYVNGVAIAGVPTTQDNDWAGATNLLIPASTIMPGATNVLAIKVRNNAPNNAWLSYRLQLSTTTGGGAPSGWEQPAFDDSAWAAAAVATISPTTPPSTGVSGTALIWPEATPASNSEQALFRQHFSVPAGLIQSAVLQLGWDDYVDAAYVNGTALSGVPTAQAEDWSGATSLAVPVGDLIAGADNCLALEGHNIAPNNAWVSYALAVTMGGARGAGAAHEGDLLYFHNGQWIDLPIGASGQELTVVAGDPAWATPSAGGSTTLAGDTDVSISSPQNGQALVYQSSDGKWHNRDAAKHGPTRWAPVGTLAGTMLVDSSGAPVMALEPTI